MRPATAPNSPEPYRGATDMPGMVGQNSLAGPFGRLTAMVSADVIATCALMFAILSGKLTFAFLLPDHLLPTFLLEFRLWGILAVVFLLRRSLRDIQQFREPIFIGTICLLAFFVVRSIGLANSAEPILDALYLAIEATAVAVLAAKQECVKTMGVMSLLLAMVLFLLALWGVRNEDLNGPGWAPIGGPITFYRIEYLGLCIALYCFMDRSKTIFLVLICAFFFATWSSLSKIAVAASIVALVPVLVVELARNQYKRLILLSLALLAGFFVWQTRLGPTMQLRFAGSAVLQEGLAGTRPVARTQVAVEEGLAGLANATPVARTQVAVEEGLAGLANATPVARTPMAVEEGLAGRANARPVARTPMAAEAILPQAAGLASTRVSNGAVPSGDNLAVDGLPPSNRSLNPGQDLFLQSEYCILTAEIARECRSNALTDRSGRLLMFAEAMRGFAQSPIIGNGLGQYAVRSINVGTNVLEVYDYPHNILAEIAFTGGAIALVLMLSFLAYTAHLFANAPLREPRSAALISFGIFMFLSALVAGDLYDFRLFFCLCIGLSVVHTQAVKRAAIAPDR